MITWPMRLTLSWYSLTGNLLAKSARRASIPSGLNRQRSKHSFGTQFRLAFGGGGSDGSRQAGFNIQKKKTKNESFE